VHESFSKELEDAIGSPRDGRGHLGRKAHAVLLGPRDGHRNHTYVRRSFTIREHAGELDGTRRTEAV
jgi:hypothetical protein